MHTVKKSTLTFASLLAISTTLTALPVFAQSGVYRCGTEYTNSAARIEQGGCTPLTGGQVTVVRSSTMRTSLAQQKIPKYSNKTTASNSSSTDSVPKTVDDSAQRTRDAGSKNILQTELDKATQRLTELKKEYNNGEPEKIGPEHRNYQKYLDRVANLKSSISRTESDIEGIKRELSRSGG